MTADDRGQAVRSLRIHAKHPCGKRDQQGIAELAREARRLS
jgi:hypothetical protein